STALVYPSGFMRLARRSSRFRPLAMLVRQGWERARVPLPSTLDFDNAIRVADDALEAADIQLPAADLVDGTVAAGRLELPRAGLTVWRDAARAVFVATRLGGVVVVYDRGNDATWRLRHEDSGYLVTSGRPPRASRWV